MSQGHACTCAPSCVGPYPVPEKKLQQHSFTNVCARSSVPMHKQKSELRRRISCEGKSEMRHGLMFVCDCFCMSASAKILLLRSRTGEDQRAKMTVAELGRKRGCQKARKYHGLCVTEDPWKFSVTWKKPLITSRVQVTSCDCKLERNALHARCNCGHCRAPSL